jgi:cell division protein FtsQ
MSSLLPSNRRVRRSDPGDEPPVSIDAPAARVSKPRIDPPAPARPGRWTRWLHRLQLITGVIVVISASVLVAWGLRRYLGSSPRFAVRIVEIEGNQRRGAQHVAKLAGVEVGKNIFELDEEQAAAAVAGDAWIETAKVTRQLPNTVRIEVAEREARLLAAVKRKLYLVDAKGDIFKEFADGDPSDMPVVTGVDADQLARDREAVMQRMRRLLELLADLERAGVSKRYPVQELHLTTDLRISAVIGSDAIRVELGGAPFRSKIQKLRRILGELRHRKVSPDVVFLDNLAHPERVVVRMR